MSNNCSKCGATEITSGKLEGKWLGFRPHQRKFWSLIARVPLSATMCNICGHIELFGDCQALAKISDQ